jgi:Importin-beta N-terminal domain
MDSTVAARRSHAIGVVAPVVSPAELYEVIVVACSQNYSQIQASGQRLKQMLNMFGTFDALQDIAARPNTPLPIRLQAIIQFKNTVVNHWRSRRCVLKLKHRYP